MPAPTSITWPMDPHTAMKHVILEKHLQAWLPILTASSGRVVVLDGFAGPGEYTGGQRGSPLIAIDTFLKHSSAQVRTFIEQDSARCAHLKQVLATRQLPNTATTQVHCGPFNQTLTNVLSQIEERSLRLAPTFAFIDPFGYSQTPMATIARLMKHDRCEVLINLMYEEINRFLSSDNAANQAHLDGLFGTRDWRNIVASPLAPGEREKRLHNLYQRQLRTSGEAKFVRSFRMRNHGNRTDYFLFFGTNSIKGLDKMKQAMWSADPSGAYDFSDATDPNQPFLFSLTPDYAALQVSLRRRFGGQMPSVQEIEEYVIAETPFHSTQYKVTALKPLEKANEIEPVSPPAGRRAGTYADMSMRLRFS